MKSGVALDELLLLARPQLLVLDENVVLVLSTGDVER
jgi:hypothetical protein